MLKHPESPEFIEDLKSHFPHAYKKPQIHPSVFVAEGARIIGDVTIGKDSSIWFNCVLRADVCRITVGERTNIQDLTLIHESFPSTATVVGNDVTIGHSVILHACKVGDFSLIGMGSCILDGAEIGEEVLLGAGSLVTQGTKVPPRSLAFGRPAKTIRLLTDEELKHLKWSARHYVNLARAYH